MSAGIFISYRRSESRHAAGRLGDDLAEAFGPESIFRDIEGIEPGLDFTRALEKALGSCVVMLVLIGPQWLRVADAQGRRRLDQPDDWIRQEIATALARDVRVVPLLLEGTPLPDAADLPPDLQPLVRRQALELSDNRWRGDLQRLVETLARVPGLTRRDTPAPAPAPVPPPAPAKSGMRSMLIGAGIGVFGLLLVAGMLAEEDEPAQPAPFDNPVPAPNPAPMPVAVTPAEGGGPDVSGLWRTSTGEVYHFEQDGRRVRFTAEAGGQTLGDGQGQLDGGLLRLAMTMRMNGVVMGTANCDMQAAPDQRSYTGMCMGPNGPFPAQMFR